MSDEPPANSRPAQLRHRSRVRVSVCPCVRVSVCPCVVDSVFRAWLPLSLAIPSASRLVGLRPELQLQGFPAEARLAFER